MYGKNKRKKFELNLSYPLLLAFCFSTYSRKKASMPKISSPNMPAIKTFVNFLGDTGEMDEVGSLVILA
jgi:hypothetical protein